MVKDTIGILADDLTGANDTGGQFSRLGAAVLVLTRLERLPEFLTRRWDAVVIDTASRNLEPERARARVGIALDWLARHAIPLVYKKIDSTLRGNIVPELQALWARGIRRLYLAPAFPLNGRTVEEGILKVDGVPVQDAEMGRDGLSPANGGHIRALLEPAFGAAVGAIGLERIERGAGALAIEMAALERDGHTIVVCDALEQGHLAVLAEALAPMLPGPVLTGSAGLARELADRWLSPVSHRPRLPTADGPVLVVAGSRSAVTAEQARRLSDAGISARIDVEPEWVDGHWEPSRAEALGARVVSALDAARAESKSMDVLLVTLGANRGGVASQRFQERSVRLNLVLGSAVRQTLERWPVGGLVLTGGDIAAAVLAALEAEGIESREEVLPGIPMGLLVGGPHANLPLVTKAGGFGTPGALIAAVRALLTGMPSVAESPARTHY